MQQHTKQHEDVLLPGLGSLHQLLCSLELALVIAHQQPHENVGVDGDCHQERMEAMNQSRRGFMSSTGTVRWP